MKVNWARFYRWSRWLHLYTSAFLFVSLLFFAVTGITLNNGWYDDDGGEQGEILVELTKQMKAGLSESQWDPDLKLIGEQISHASGLQAPDRVDLSPEFLEVIFEYKLPAGRAVATVRADRAWVEYESGSLLSVANALHKSRDGGKIWEWLVDLMAAGMVVFALTGITLIFQNRSRRFTAILAVILGGMTPIGVYLLGVPSLG